MTGHQTILDEVLKECETVLRHHDMYYSGELCEELQYAFEKISRSTIRRSVSMHGSVSFSQVGIAGFSRVIVLDAKRAVSPIGIFHFEVFIQNIARAIAEALGFDLDTRNLHREQLSQLLKDERNILFCFFSVDYLTEGHHRQLRGLGFTQTDHRILFCGRNEFLRRQWTSSAESPRSNPGFSRARIVHSDSGRSDSWWSGSGWSDYEQKSPELTPNAHLRVLAGRCLQPVYLVDMGGVSIGREGCDVVIMDDPRLSRKHARIERSFDGWQFQDLGSRNGSYVNGRESDRGLRTPLPDGSVIRLGDSVMVFRATPPPAVAARAVRGGSSRIGVGGARVHGADLIEGRRAVATA